MIYGRDEIGPVIDDAPPIDAEPDALVTHRIERIKAGEARDNAPRPSHREGVRIDAWSRRPQAPIEVDRFNPRDFGGSQIDVVVIDAEQTGAIWIGQRRA